MARTGKRGRPRKQLNPQFVAEPLASHRKITITKLAQIMGIGRRTLTRHLQAHGLLYKFTDLSKTELDALVSSLEPSAPQNQILASDI